MVPTSGNAGFLPSERAGRSHKNRVMTLALLLLVGVGMPAMLVSLIQDASASASTPSLQGPKSNAPGAPSSLDPDCGPDWTIVSSPSPGTHENILNGLAAISSDDVWAVGYTYTPPGLSQTLIEHWDGSLWSVIPSPNGGTNADNSLNGVAVLSSDDIWAVGTYGPESDTLTEHWNGTQWSVAYSVNPGTTRNILHGIAGTQATDVWAVGYSESDSIDHTLIERWDGSMWSLVNSPGGPTGRDSMLNGVAVVSQNDVWAVGNYHDASNTSRMLIQHWNGSAWSDASSQPVGTSGDALNGVSVMDANDVWAVGLSYESGNTTHMLIEHWDGTQWSYRFALEPGLMQNSLNAVAPISASDVWAVGYYDNTSDPYDSRTLVEHWSGPGTGWTVISSPNVDTYDNFLNGIAAISSSDIWAAGDYADDVRSQTLVEHYNPCPPTSTPTPTAAGTNTPFITPSATSTPMQFGDVPPGSPFYTYVECLVGRGIINGYPDGTFKPNNPVTRGQLSKIVSNSAGYSDQHTSQTFQDVPTASTFYQFIERLASRSFISGYVCGGPGEPCSPPANLPYFRPNADMTRGQTSKIVASAKGLPSPPSGQQTFQDVPTNSTFWRWIEALATTGAIQGYPCGGTGEPCMPPGNLPYFRPSNDVTRGQSTKIVGNTFFPDCSSR